MAGFRYTDSLRRSRSRNDKYPHLQNQARSGAASKIPPDAAHLKLGTRVKVVSEREAAALISDTQEIGRMLQGLIKSLERSVDNARG